MGHSSGKTRKLHVYIYSLYVDGHMHTCIVLEFLRGHRVRVKGRIEISYNLAMYGNAKGNFICLEGKRVEVRSLENTNILRLNRERVMKKEGLFREFGDS